MTPEINASWSGSIRNREVPYREFNLTVGELPPFFDDWGEAALRRLIDNFACLKQGASRGIVNICSCCSLAIRSAKSRGRTSMWKLQSGSMRMVAISDRRSQGVGNGAAEFSPLSTHVRVRILDICWTNVKARELSH